ncbi:MAG: hypothetical protein U0744_04340 [Gemmataceae bacterium]
MRTTLALALGALLAFSGAAFAQPGGFGKKKDFGPKEGGGVEAELKKLREQIRDLEAKVKSAEAKKSDKKDFSRAGEPEKKGFGPGGFGKMDPEKMKQMMERFKEMKKGEGKEAAKGKDGKKGPPWARGEGERKGPPAKEGGERKMGPGGFGRPGFGPQGKDGERRFGPGGPGGRGPGGPPAARGESRRLDDLERKVDEILRILRRQSAGGPGGRGR